MKFTKITVLLCGIVTISLIAGVVYVGGNKNSIDGTNDSVLKFNAKTVSYALEETSKQEEPLTQEELPKEVEDSQEQNNLSNKDTENVKKEEIPSFEGLTGIEFVKYTVKANDTLWKIVKANMPNYNSYPVGGVAGVVSYIGEQNNLSKDRNNAYIVYSGQKITIPREKNIAAKSNENNNDNSSVTVNTNLSVVKKTDITSKPSTNNATSTTQNSNISSESMTKNSSTARKENTSTQVSGEHSGH